MQIKLKKNISFIDNKFILNLPINDPPQTDGKLYWLGLIALICNRPCIRDAIQFFIKKIIEHVGLFFVFL